MKKKPHKKIVKLDITRMIENGIVSIITGMMVALFSFWLMKTYGFSIGG